VNTVYSAGSLTVVGTGIQLGVHLTPEARAAIEQADEVLYVVADTLTSAWLQELNPKARSLASL
jgi:precorrin-3B methylase